MTLEQRAEKWRGEVMHWDCECSDDHLAAFARTELLKAAEIAEHFANDKLTPEEWPEYGLYERAKRFDNGAVGATGDNIAAAIRRLAE